MLYKPVIALWHSGWRRAFAIRMRVHALPSRSCVCACPNIARMGDAAMRSMATSVRNQRVLLGGDFCTGEPAGPIGRSDPDSMPAQHKSGCFGCPKARPQLAIHSMGVMISRLLIGANQTASSQVLDPFQNCRPGVLDAVHFDKNTPNAHLPCVKSVREQASSPDKA